MGPTNCRAAAALAIVVAVLLAGCGGGSSTATRQSSSPSGSHALPSPFAVVARYSARSLGLDAPHGLAIGPNGDVYITDFSQRVTVVSPAGRVLRRWGKRGHRPGEFDFVSADPSSPKQVIEPIAVGPNGVVYVSDSGNARVEVFTRQGRFVREFGSLGRGNGQFLMPFELTVDKDGNAYVLDGQLVGAVDKFSPTGKFLWRIGGEASSDPDLAGHHHLASIDSHGRLVMFNEETAAVVYLDGNGHKLDSFNASGGLFPAGTNPCEVTVEANGNTYVTGCGRGPGCEAVVCAGTLVFDRGHRLIAEWANPNVPMFSSPTFGPNGEVFALGQDGSLIRLRITLPGG
jgi:DNA-binding beta-propeller fold protein YncE